MFADGTRPFTESREGTTWVEVTVYVEVDGLFEVSGWSETIGVYKGWGASSARTNSCGFTAGNPSEPVLRVLSSKP